MPSLSELCHKVKCIFKMLCYSLNEYLELYVSLSQHYQTTQNLRKTHHSSQKCVLKAMKFQHCLALWLPYFTTAIINDLLRAGGQGKNIIVALNLQVIYVRIYYKFWILWLKYSAIILIKSVNKMFFNMQGVH